MKTNQLKTVFLGIIVEIILITEVGCANLFPNPVNYFFFYNILYGVIFSFLLPIFFIRRERNVFYFVGLKNLGKRQIIVLILFVVFSVGGQLIPLVIAGETIPWNLLPNGIIPLIMTTFFEEFLFRGFFQNKFERDFGVLPAIVVSGFMFSLYHLGYPGFRTFADLFLLFFVGVGFAAAYKLSGNNLIVAYFVNLPNAFVTYILKYKQFPVMTIYSTIAGIITLCIIIIVFILLKRADKKL